MRDTPSCLPASTSQRPAQPRYMQFLSLSYYPVHGFVYASGPDTHAHGLLQGQSHSQTQQQQQQQTDPNISSTTQPTPPMLMTTIPLPSSATLFQHFVYACQPFWCHRHTHTVLGGVVYDVGDFRIRLGDVRQTQPAARVRGTVVEVEWRGPSLVDSILSTVAATAALSSRGDANKEDKESVEGSNGDGDSGVDMVFDSIEEADVDAEYVATAALIREFWAKLGVEGAREAILVPDVGKEVKERLRRWRQQEGKGQRNTREDDEGENGQTLDEDPDPEAGVDVARQFMEILRFNR